MISRAATLLLASASLIAFSAQPAFAGQTTTATDDEIVVTGSALARQRAIDVKRDDIRIVEALGSDELGQFPDNNIGESVNRLPGVSVLVEKGEGRYVQVRGVAANLNHVTINGLSMGSPEVEDGGRQAPLDIISAGVLNRVEVIKTRTPDMDGQGIGGTVNVVTQMPFDRPDDLYGRVSARIGREGIRPRKAGYGGHEPWSVDGMVSGKTTDDTFGWLIGATYTAREYSAIGIYQDDWDSATGQPLPINVKNNYYVIGRQRLNLNAALEWRPDDNNMLFARAFYGKWDEFQHRNRYEENFTAGVVPSGPTNGASGPNRVLPNIRLEYSDKKVLSLALGAKSEFDALTLDYIVQYNRNQISDPNSFWEFRSAAVFGPNRYSIADNGVVTIAPNAGTPDRLNPAAFPLRRYRVTTSDMTEEGGIGALNLTYAVNEQLRLKAGVKAARTKRAYDLNTAQYDPGASLLTLATSAGFTDGGFVNVTPAGSAPNILLDIDALDAFFANPANAAFFRRNTGVSLNNDFGSDYGIEETVLAAFAQGTWESDTVTAIGGVRVERTDIDSSGFLIRGGRAVRIAAEGDYTTWLPSLVVNWRPDDQWVVRGGITRSLGRPGYNSIAPRSTFTNVSSLVGQLSVGNPGLRPRTAWSYDASVEFYPDRLSSFAVALFQKDIDDDFVGATDTFNGAAAISDALAARGFAAGAIDISGLTRLDVSTTINAGSTRIQGIELIAQTQFSFLPSPLDGFGASATATFLKGRTTLVNGDRNPVQGQPKRTLAASLFYQKAGFDASVSYAWNGSYLTDLNSDPDLVLDQGAYGRIDARISYTFGNGLRIFAEGVNLNNEPTSEFQGGRREWNTEYEYVGRTFYIGAGFSF